MKKYNILIQQKQEEKIMQQKKIIKELQEIDNNFDYDIDTIQL